MARYSLAKYYCEEDRSFSLTRGRPSAYSCMHSISDTWWGDSFSPPSKDGLVLRCKDSHLETAPAFFRRLVHFCIAGDPTMQSIESLVERMSTG